MSKSQSKAYHEGGKPDQLSFNLRAALKFCRLIDPKTTLFDFRSIGPEYEPKPHKSFRHRQWDITSELKQQWLKGANREGRGIYMTINETDGHGVDADSIVRVRAVYADLDDGLPKSWPLEPSFVVNSSPGKYQAYWLLSDELTREQFANVMRGIGQRWGSANEAKDICRVLRVPGFWHQKNKDKPYRVRFHGEVSEEPARYTAAKLGRVFAVKAEKPKAQRKRLLPSNDNWTSDDVRSLLEVIPAYWWDERENWLAAGMALHDHFDGGPTGYDIWCHFSQQSDKFDERDSQHTWNSFGQKSGGVTLGSLVHAAKEHGWEPSKRDDQDDQIDAINKAAGRLRRKKRSETLAKAKSVSAEHEDDDGIHLVRASDLKGSPIVRWLWQDRIIEGEINMIAGDAGAGKSTVIYDIIARITTGKPWPDGIPACAKRDVVIFTPEGDPKKFIEPSLLAAGADITKVFFEKAPDDTDFDKKGTIKNFLSLDTDIGKLARTLERNKDIGLIIFDPLNAYVGKINPNDDAGIRRIMTPLNRVANRYGIAILFVAHFNKKSDLDVMYRAGGSVAIVAATRSAYICSMIKPTDDEEKNDERIFAPIRVSKSVRWPIPSLKYKVEAKHYSQKHNDMGLVASWLGQTETSAQDALRPVKATKKDEAATWLDDFLNSCGKTASKTIFEEGSNMGYSKRTLERVKAKLGIEHVREGMLGQFYWLPRPKV